MRVSGPSILALHGAASLAATIPGSSSNTTPVNKDTATIAPRGTTGVLKCLEHKTGADHSGWYQECMDIIAETMRGDKSSGVGYLGSVGDYGNNAGCTCSVGGEGGEFLDIGKKQWPFARQKLWDDVINNDRSCNNISFAYGPEDSEKAVLSFKCT
ncbi:hypothetical protein FQN49_007084 [Arthroderma sp. PD_2]|nr:hypothetical protein FQN49_007084 [Arthroderma sp. PD_2]